MKIEVDGEVVEPREATDSYIWGDRRELKFHRCNNCGCMVYWFADVGKKAERMGINCRMLERGELEKLEIKKSNP